MTIDAPLAAEVGYAVIAGLALTLTQPRAMRRRIWRQPGLLLVAVVMGVLLALGLAVPTIILVWVGLPLAPAAAIPLVAWVWFCRATGRARDDPILDRSRASSE